MTGEPVRQLRYRRPPGSTELILVRHGESAEARPDRPFALVDGQGDPELAEEGRVQAEQVGARLFAEGDVDAVYVTNLRRTSETAAPFLRLTGGSVPATIEPDLREVHLGAWEGGVFRAKVAGADPLAVRMVDEERWDVIPGAESADAFNQRVRAAVERIAASHPDQRVVVFTHGGVIGRILSEASGARPFAFVAADNGSISHVVITRAQWTVRRFNDTAHLAAGLTTRAAPLT